MEISVVNEIGQKRTKAKPTTTTPNNPTEETSPMVQSLSQSIIKVKDVDINKTVQDLKRHLYNSLNLSSKISFNRIGVSYVFKKGDKDYKTFLSDNNQSLFFYEAITAPSTVFYVKDLGPQINYRLVYVLEYLGPFISCIIFFIRYYIIFHRKPENKDKEIPINILLYFFMSLFHYGKRIMESIFVHIFSRSTMPLKNLFKNCAYYWGIFGLGCCWTLFNPNSGPITFLKAPRYFMVAFFFSAELKNLKTHMILREIKVKGKGKKYMPPKIEGFELVTCANYLWEFFAWVSFSLFSCNIFVIIFTICGFLQMKEWALKKHMELKRNYGDKYSKEIFAFIPYIV